MIWSSLSLLGCNFTLINAVTIARMRTCLLALRRPFLKKVSDLFILKKDWIWNQLLLFVDKHNWQANEPYEEDKEHCALVFLFQKETRKGNFHRLVSLRAVRVAILLPVIVLLGVSEDLMSLDYLLELHLYLLAILHSSNFIRMILNR